MKKTLIFAVIIVSLLAVSCKSTPKTAADITDEYFYSVYNRYSSGLNLAGADSYTVRSGDSLVSISQQFYNTGYYYPVIMLASKDIIKDPDKLQPGMLLTIPNLENNKTASAIRSIKGVMNDCADIDELRGRSATAKGLRDLAASL